MYFENLDNATLSSSDSNHFQIYLGDPKQKRLSVTENFAKSSNVSKFFLSKFQNYLETQVMKTLNHHQQIYFRRSSDEVEHISNYNQEMKENHSNQTGPGENTDSSSSQDNTPEIFPFLMEASTSNIFHSRIPTDPSEPLNVFVHNLQVIAINKMNKNSKFPKLSKEIISFTQKLFNYLFLEKNNSRGILYLRAQWAFQQNLMNLLERACEPIFEFKEKIRKKSEIPSIGSSANSSNFIGNAGFSENKMSNLELQRSIRNLKNEFFNADFNINTEKLIKLFWSLLAFISNLLKRANEFENLFVQIKHGRVELIAFLKSMTKLMLLKESPILGNQACEVLMNFLDFSGEKKNSFIKKSN